MMSLADTFSRIVMAMYVIGIMSILTTVIVVYAAASGAIADPTIDMFLILWIAIMFIAGFVLIFRTPDSMRYK